jgi:L,D-transpeptidase YbiS
VEPGVLGDYALGFGKGYFIHGTLYPRLLGKSVTHGCIRLNDDDLKRVYQLARVGTPILIF